MASNAEKLAILQSSTEPMVILGYIKKDGSFRLVRARLDVPGKNGGKANYDAQANGQITIYDMDVAKSNSKRAHRHLVLNSIGWAIVNGILYDFRKKSHKSDTNTNLNSVNQIDNNASGQTPINRNTDPDTIYSSCRKMSMIKISRTSRAIAVAINGMAYGNAIQWRPKNMISHVPGDSGSVSDIYYVSIKDLPKGMNLRESDVLSISKELKTNPSSVPAIVVKEEADGSYHVIDGAHRIEACRRLGISPVPIRLWSPEEGVNVKRDLKNIKEAFEDGSYPRPAELQDEGEQIIKKYQGEILKDPEMTSDAIEILMRIPNFSLKIEWSHLLSPGKDRERLERHIGENF